MTWSMSNCLSQAPVSWVGAVYGVVLNHRASLDALGDAVHQPPYKAPPQWPVLYIKPRNTHLGTTEVTVPDDAPELELGASLAMVVGQTASRVSPAQALSHVAAYLTVADVRVPHSVYYRPSVRFIARDGFCPMAAQATPASAIAHPDELAVKVWVDDELVHTTTTGDRIRGAAQLLADVSIFMTLHPGDLLLLGVSHGAPRVKSGQHSRIEIAGLAPLCNRFVSEVASCATAG
jgi:5-oxopent-3-ene-1,2,5-tricarboxylate decarboxylase/2-hydroxyhepta-2,4-diene-1,7-dioate isomerase